MILAHWPLLDPSWMGSTSRFSFSYPTGRFLFFLARKEFPVAVVERKWWNLHRVLWSIFHSTEKERQILKSICLGTASFFSYYSEKHERIVDLRDWSRLILVGSSKAITKFLIGAVFQLIYRPSVYRPGWGLVYRRFFSCSTLANKWSGPTGCPRTFQMKILPTLV